MPRHDVADVCGGFSAYWIWRKERLVQESYRAHQKQQSASNQQSATPKGIAKIA